MYFSDVYADKEVPKHVTKDKILYGKNALVAAEGKAE